MTIIELLNLAALALGLFMTIAFINLLLQKMITGSIRSLLFKSGTFILLSALILLFPLIMSVLGEPIDLVTTVKTVLLCLWWFSLNFLVNEALTYFIWDQFLANKGITVSKLLRDLVSFALIILTIAAIFHFVLDKSVVGLFTASGVMAIILGYSAQATLGEAFAGIGLNITKQFDQGDWIGLSGVHGKVVDINWRFVNLLTLDGNYLSIPNSQITKEKITNYSKPNPIHGITIKIPVTQALSPETVKKLLISAATQSSKVALTPQPLAALVEYQAVGNHMYQLTYYTGKQNEALVTDEILSIFWYQCQREELAENKIKITSCSVDDIQLFLKKMDLFSSLHDDEIAELSQHCTYRFYGPPERILAQGQSNQSLFLIYKGSVDVYIKTPENQEIKVASINEGAYFGEMSLLTGDPAGATIIVSTESMIIEVNHENMGNLFTNRPELVEKISAIVVQRKLHNENMREALKANRQKETQSLISQLASRVKNFFKKSAQQNG